MQPKNAIKHTYGAEDSVAAACPGEYFSFQNWCELPTLTALPVWDTSAGPIGGMCLNLQIKVQGMRDLNESNEASLSS